ncbi:MAG: dicarboxylate/amino acid:cation symporter, partial [candidate division KSB1 bacterium]|nr:dicarboxylate/amino acid:cation symporter [candidate division KSB1 bacterium]
GVLAVGSTAGIVRLGTKTMGYFIGSTLLAILTGQMLVKTFKPGVGASLTGLQQNLNAVQATTDRRLIDLLYQLIPENVFQSLATGQVLPVITFCIFAGIFILNLDEPYKTTMANLIEAGYRVMMKIVGAVIRLAPIGVAAITAKITALTGLAVFKSLGLYFLTVLVGLFLHGLITLPLLLMIFARIRPWKHYAAVAPALLTAFSTSSSMAALPLNLDCTINKSRVSRKIASFVLPIGATINMNGTALYECVAVLFIAQVYGIPLTWLQEAIVVLTALLAAVGSAGIPMAGLVMMSIILQAVGLPLEGVGLVLAVDRLLDMFRTTINVLGDSCGAVIIARSEGETLANLR